MALINRITRLIKTDFHAVLDQIEEPEQILKQSIRDMEDELVLTQQELTQTTFQYEAVMGRLSEFKIALDEQDRELELCFQSGEEQLARSLVRKKLETGHLLKRITSNSRLLQKQIQQKQSIYHEQAATLERLRQKAELFIQTISAGPAEYAPDQSGWLEGDMSVSAEEVEIAFLREKRSRGDS
jgi:phage shock protein A